MQGSGNNVGYLSIANFQTNQESHLFTKKINQHNEPRPLGTSGGQMHVLQLPSLLCLHSRFIFVSLFILFPVQITLDYHLQVKQIYISFHPAVPNAQRVPRSQNFLKANCSSENFNSTLKYKVKPAILAYLMRGPHAHMVHNPKKVVLNRINRIATQGAHYNFLLLGPLTVKSGHAHYMFSSSLFVRNC